MGALECLHHRGPDETGIDVIDGDAVFAHKRLSIIDVESSHEPLSYADGRYVLTFNGEIYNYLELREELAREHGAAFATLGDAEAVVAGYHFWGERVLTRLRGMFAFVIWDRQERRAFGARDYFGIKPMYYLESPDGLYLSSEKKALLELAGPRPVDTASLSHYLTLQYVPEPRTLHEGIQRIGSGELLRWKPGVRSRSSGGSGRSSSPRRSTTSRRSSTGSARRCATASGCTCGPTCRSGRSCPAASTPPRSWRWPASSTPAS
ncbi:hypothetical protein Psuf_007020 [Phytohabitans suffuscus]|uniref:asparagine synthase (glutamine-hydrolyzing) n=1 Tax=Phytohabitans suffuscus TaxID=624315 RepID=A0A6F8YBI3_9ACTN|nr:hypothetical protein Psuf_007020 [Phytohabitans suffuscus]